MEKSTSIVSAGDKNVLREFLAESGSEAPRNVAHIGAHFGEQAVVYEELGAKKVIWIEAGPETYKQLCNSLSNRSVGRVEHVMVNALIADMDGEERPFYIAGQTGEASSLLRQTEQLRKKLPWLAETGEVLQAPTFTIDTILHQAGMPIGEVDTLVLDVQGAELMCLAGLDAYTSGIRYLVSKGTTSGYFEGGALFDDLCEVLNERGFLYVPMGVNTSIAGMHCDFMFLRSLDGKAIFNDADSDIKMRGAVNELIDHYNLLPPPRHLKKPKANSDFGQAVSVFAEHWDDKLGAANTMDVLTLLLDLTWRADCKDAWRSLLIHGGYIEA